LRGATVAVQAIRDVLNFAAARGVDAAGLAREAGVDPRKLADNNARLAGSSLGRLWELAAERTGDPLFGLHLGAMATPGGLGILGYAMLSSRSLGAALDRLVRYGHLYTFGIDFDVLRSGDVLRIECRVVRHVDNYLIASPRHPLECTIAAIRAVSSSLVGRTVPVRSVTLGHADPGFGHAAYEPLLGVRPLFDRGVYAVELDGRAADWPIATANNEMLDALDARADRLLAELSSGRTVTDSVMRAISRLLKEEPPRIDEVAQGLAMSSRSLQRALTEEGTTYQELLDQTRRGLAVRYLADPGAVIFEVAILLGFSEPSAFHRAFKRWTGHTPRQFQRLGRDAAPLQHVM
jgi:AraC-like DNA-binding protein